MGWATPFAPGPGGSAGWVYCLAPLGGTGSNPPREKGLHLRIRQMVRTDPRQKPRAWNASAEYWLQLG